MKALKPKFDPNQKFEVVSDKKKYSTDDGIESIATIEEKDPRKQGVQRDSIATKPKPNIYQPFSRTTQRGDAFGLQAKKELYTRKEGDVYFIPARADSENGDARIPTTKSLKGLGNYKDAIAQASANNFKSWYTDPETIKRFGDNTNMDPNRLQDFVGKGLRTEAKEVGIGTLGKDIYGGYRDENRSNTKTGQVLYRTDNPQGDKISQKELDANIQHEFVHASKLDSVLGEKLREVTGFANKQKGKGYAPDRLEYMSNPQESYGNFHGFRVKLGLKPGQKVNEATLKDMVKRKKLEDDNFYQTYDDENIVKAINTIAFKKEIKTKSTEPNWLDSYA